MITYSQKFLKQRRFLTVLPLIVLPFLVLVFWLLGGGSGSKSIVAAKTGLNTQLPDANLKTQSAMDKMSFYAMADRDSMKREEQLRMDPNYQQRVSISNLQREESGESLNRKVARLHRQVEEEPVYVSQPVKKEVVQHSDDIDRLQMMVQSISQKKADPEMEALNGTLDKLLELQNPGKGKKASMGVTVTENKNNPVFSVSANGLPGESSYFGNASNEKANSFLSDRDQPKDSAKSRVIMAVVHNEQTILAGSVVKLRLVQDVFVNGERIPAGSFVFGNSSIDDVRLKVAVHSIQYQNHLYRVALSVVDIDGIEGINIPGSNGREVAKQSVDQGIQSVGGLSFDPSLKAQAAAAGVNAAKNLLSKQVKQVRVTIKAGYKVLLKDENEKNN
jgi:conjugative transposon TraM protein